MRWFVPLVGLVVVACGSDAQRSMEARPGPLRDEVAAGGVVLTLTAERGTYASDEVIGIEATMASADGQPVVLSGSGHPVGFSVTRLEDGLTSGEPAFTADCQRHEIREPVTHPFAKSGGIEDQGPNAEFHRAYFFGGPELRLPVGTWRIEASTALTIGRDCRGNALGLTPAVEVVVTD